MLNRSESDETHTPVVLPSGTPEQPTESPELPEALRLLALVGTDENPYKNGGPWAYADKENMRSRCFFITQNTHYGDVEIFSLDQAQSGCDRKGMTEYAYILHDRDTYSAEDIASGNAPVDAVVDDPKANHIHTVVRRKSMATVGAIARAFGVPPQQVEKKAASAFYDLVEYLTHEHPDQQERGKHLYSRSEVVTNVADLWERLDKHKEDRKKSKVDEKDVFKKVSDGELTLADVREEYPDIYVKKGNLSHMRILRNDYISRLVPPAKVINIYLCGGGGNGKDAEGGTIAKVLAELFEWRIFKVGADNVTFENYDGEEIIIWEDKRAAAFLHACGGRGDAFRVLGPYRKDTDRMVVNVKNSKVTLVNHVNIITAVTPYREFISGLAGTYKDRNGVELEAEDEGQAYRRIQIVIEVERGSYTMHVNKGFAEGTGDYFDYLTTSNLAQNFEQLYRDSAHIKDEEERMNVVAELGKQTVMPVIDEVKRLMNRGDDLPEMTADELRAKYAHLGTQQVGASEQTAEEESSVTAAEESRVAVDDLYFSPHGRDATGRAIPNLRIFHGSETYIQFAAPSGLCCLGPLQVSRFSTGTGEATRYSLDGTVVLTYRRDTWTGGNVTFPGILGDRQCTSSSLTLSVADARASFCGSPASVSDFCHFIAAITAGSAA